MAVGVGFATLGGGDTVSFHLTDLDSSQISAVQSALASLSLGKGSDVSSVAYATWQNTGDYNVYNLDGGTTVLFASANTDAIVLDSVGAGAGTSLTGTYDRAQLWVGNQGNDTITIGAPSQTIFAGDGNNTIDLNSLQHSGGVDSISVGTGADTITMIGSGTVSALDQAGGGDTISVNASFGAGSAASIGAGDGNDSITFIGLAGTVTAGNGNDTINFTGGGLVSVGGGSDSITFAGDVSIVAGGTATVTGSLTDSTDIAGNSHATVQGGSGTFVFTGHDGFDSVTAGTGAATLNAGNGNDTFHAGAAVTAVLDARGTGGDDALYGGSGSATLWGGTGSDSFFGGSGGTTMMGGSGYSFFQGSAGSNSMVGGSSWNFFTGGSGSDTMVANTVPTASFADPNVFNFDATVGGSHQIVGYDSTAPGGDTAIHLTFSGYGLTSAQIVADSTIVNGGKDTLITIPGAGGNPTTTITIKDYTGIADWNITTH